MQVDELPGRTLALGDIHGCDTALAILLRELELTSRDTLVLLGDVIDRGPGTSRVMDQLVDVGKTSRLIYVMGNHEEMLWEALGGRETKLWLRNGGDATLASYEGSLTHIPDEHLQLFQEMVPYWESPQAICVHAGLEIGLPWEDQRAEWLRWRKLTGREFPHPSGKPIVCGHTGVGTDFPLILNGWVCLDTLAYEGGYLTCLDVATGELWQTRQSGEFRGGITLNDIPTRAGGNSGRPPWND